VSASLRGMQEAVKDPKSALDALMQNVPDLERAYQEKVWAMLVDKIMGVKHVTPERPFGYNDPEIFKSTIEVLTKYGTLKNPPPLDTVFDNRFVEASYRATR
jgi:hypothetical protein